MKLYRTEILKVIVPSCSTVVLLAIVVYLIGLPVLKKSFIEQKKVFISNETQTARSVLSYFESYAQSGRVSEAEAKKLAIAQIRALRYGSDEDYYFWINDTCPTMIMHPYRPELEGQDLSNLVDPEGKLIFKDLKEIVLENGAGFSYYSWQLGNDSTSIAPKISYVMLFEPWGWIIGTGMYIVDVEAEVAKIANKLTLSFSIVLTIVFIISLFIIKNGIREIEKRKIAENELKKHLNKLEETVEERTNELTELNKTKDRLFSIIAHDLRGPIGSLQNILDIVENLENKKDYENINEFIKIAKDTSKNIFELLENLLQWASSQLDSLSINVEEINIAKVISGTIELLRPAINEKSINLNNTLPEQALAFADKNMINTVVRNLLSNAIKFTNCYGSITIRAVYENKLCIVSIQDNGVGIEKKRLNSLFIPNKNFSTQGTSGEKGSGLGLVLSNEFINKNNGKLWVESAKGKGSTFYFCLQAAKKDITI